jgi:hypothetical protein
MTLRYFKVGGLRFLRLGRLQLSFCVCRAKAKPARVEPTADMFLPHWANY